MAFKRNVLIDDTIYSYHEVVSVTEKKEGERVYINSWITEEDSKSLVKVPKSMSFLIPNSEDSASSVISKCEEWAKDSGKYPEYVDPAQEALDTVLPILTDEQAEQVPDAFPSWAAGVEYSVGYRVKWSEYLWKCVQAHTSQEGWEPDVATSLWSRIGDPADEWPEWIQPTGAHDAYALGSKVSHNGGHWISIYDANVYEPGVYGWEAAE